jgi:DNA replication protein DnaC
MTMDPIGKALANVIPIRAADDWPDEAPAPPRPWRRLSLDVSPENRARVGLTPALQRMRLEHYRPSPATHAAYEWACRFAWTAKPERGAVLAGPCGVGKSHLAAGVANARLEGGGRVRLWSVPMLADELRLFVGGHRTNDPLAVALDVYTLVLDDLGAERPTPFVLERLYRLVNHRLEHDLPIIVTTNFAEPAALAARLGHEDDVIGERIVSRLRGACEWFVLDGQDQRVRP